MRKITAKEKSFLHSLQKKKNRELAGVFVVENFRTIRDASQLEVYPEFVTVSASFIHEQKDLIQLLEQKGVEVTEMENRDSSYLSFLETPQGIVATYAKQPETCDLAFSTVYLDGIADPGNAGTLMRSAVAFGISNVVFGPLSVDPYNPKVVSAAKESIFSLHLSTEDHMSVEAIASRVPVYALTVQGGVMLQDVVWKNPFCLVIGSEAHGVQEETAKHVTTNITIPMAPRRVESLNAAVSASIALASAYHASKKS